MCVCTLLSWIYGFGVIFSLLWFCLLLSSSSFQGVEFLHFWSFQFSFNAFQRWESDTAHWFRITFKQDTFFSASTSRQLGAILIYEYNPWLSTAQVCVCYCVSFWRVWNEFDFGKIIINKCMMIYGAVSSFSPWNMNLFEWKGVAWKRAKKKFFSSVHYGNGLNGIRIETLYLFMACRYTLVSLARNRAPICNRFFCCGDGLSVDLPPFWPLFLPVFFSLHLAISIFSSIVRNDSLHSTSFWLVHHYHRKKATKKNME